MRTELFFLSVVSHFGGIFTKSPAILVGVNPSVVLFLGARLSQFCFLTQVAMVLHMSAKPGLPSRAIQGVCVEVSELKVEVIIWRELDGDRQSRLRLSPTSARPRIRNREAGD